MKRVTGLGGFFFRSKNKEKMNQWYSQHLGIDIKSWGAVFKWRDTDEPEKVCTTSWSIFDQDTDYLDPSTSSFMVNYRVENLVELLKVLKEEGVTVVGEIQEFEYGKFGWILDPDGNKIELWEPIDDKL